jgi:fructokinase
MSFAIIMETIDKNILGIGEILWDKLPTGPKPGGAPMNAALHLAQLGYKPKLASSVGNDDDGRKLKKFIEQAGIDTSLVQTNNELPTSEVLVTLDSENNATYEIVEPVAWDQIILTPELKKTANEAEIIIYGSLAARNKTTRDTILSLLKNNKAIRLMDVNFRPPYDTREVVEQLIKYADIVKMNEEELFKFKNWHNIKTSDSKKLILWFSDFFNINQVCVTRGKKGAVIYNKGLVVEHPGFSVKTIDSVGSGDAFLAGFIHCLIKEKNLQETVSYACALGAFVATRQGATPEYEFEDIDVILNNGKLNQSNA